MLVWHGLAKLRMHTDHTLRLLELETIRLGRKLRHFQSVVCSHYETLETAREAAARARAQAARANSSAAGAQTNAGGRRRRVFNLCTSKIHALGDYVSEIKAYGSTDGYSTQLVRTLTLLIEQRPRVSYLFLQGEHEHRRVKARYRLTSKNKATAQIVQRDAYDNEMRFKAQLLRDQGIDIPFPQSMHPKSIKKDGPTRDSRINDRYFIAKDEKGKLGISETLHRYRHDPAYQVSVFTLKPIIKYSQPALAC